MEQFIDYVIANSDEYGMSDFSRSFKCFGGKLYGDEDGKFFLLIYDMSSFPGIVLYLGNLVTKTINNLLLYVHTVHFFITPHQSHTMDNKNEAFDLCVITFTQGRNLDYTQGPSVGQRLSDYIFDLAKSTLLDIIEKASIDYVRDQLWVEQSDWV